MSNVEIGEILEKVKQGKGGKIVQVSKRMTEEKLENIEKMARKIKREAKFLVCIGLGESEAGVRGVIEALRPKGETKVLYTGNSFSTIELSRILEKIGNKSFAVLLVVREKMAVEAEATWYFFRNKLVEKYGEKAAAKRIYVCATKEEELPENIDREDSTIFEVETVLGGGAVLSEIGLLPMAVAGIKIKEVMEGAREGIEQMATGLGEELEVVKYVETRLELCRKGYGVEFLVSFEPCMQRFMGWWSQILSNSWRKVGEGILSVATSYTDEIVKFGQVIERGERNIFETFLRFEEPSEVLVVPMVKGDLSELSEKSFHYLNDQAFVEIVRRHQESGVATLVLELEKAGKGLSEKMMGYLVVFVEVAGLILREMAKNEGVDEKLVLEDYCTTMRKLFYKR